MRIARGKTGASIQQAGSAQQPTLEIRLATHADVPDLVRLMAEMDDLQGDPQDQGVAHKMRTTMDAMALYPDFRIYIVVEGGLPVASFSLMIFCSPSHNGMLQALLDAVVVQRERRGAGLGAIMLEYAMHMASEARCYKLMLSSNIKRADAHRFYENLGFSQHGISFSIDLSPDDIPPVLQ